MNKEYPISLKKKKEYDAKDFRFVDVVIDILHTGKNLNMTTFDKDVVDKAIPTLYNTPILGYIVNEDDPESEDFKGHEFELKIEDGSVKYSYKGKAYGVIPESCNPRWIVKDDGTGVEREYLRVDGLVWTKFDDPIDIFSRDIVKNQSMEITDIQSVKQEDGFEKITSFKFDGCCLLSTTDERIMPAMVGSCAVANFSVDNVIEEIKDKLNQYSEIKNFSTNDESNKEKGDIENMNKETDDKKNTENVETYTLSANQLWESLVNIFDAEKIPSNWDSEYMINKYFLMDIVGNEAIVENMENKTIEGIEFSVSGDNVSVDYAKCKRKKYAYVDWEDDSDSQKQNSVIEALESILTEKMNSVNETTSNYEALNEKYTTLSNEYNEVKTKYDEYVKKEEENKAEELKKKKDSLFAIMDESIGDDEKYSKLKEDENISYEDLETQCYAILGRKNMNFAYVSNKNKNNGAVKFGVGGSKKEDSNAYGGVVEKYRKN